MVDNPLEHFRVTISRHLLKGVIEIAVVSVRTNMDTRRHASTEARQIQTPLLPGLTSEKFIA